MSIFQLLGTERHSNSPESAIGIGYGILRIESFRESVPDEPFVPFRKFLIPGVLFYYEIQNSVEVVHLYDITPISGASLSIGLWIPAGLLMLPLPFLIWGSIRRRRALRKGLCLVCGYNLTANISRRCPECGTHRVSSQ